MKFALKFLLPVLILLAAALGAYGIFVSRPEPETRRPVVSPPLVRTVTVVREDVPLLVRSQGTVSPRVESQLVPEVAGRVLEVAGSFVPGGFFETGDVLVTIDPYDYRQAIVEARAMVAQAKLRLAREEAEAEVARREWRELGTEEEPTPLTLREPQVEDARAALAAAEAALERAERNLDRTRIRAPYAGRVRSKRVDVGQYVTPGVSVATVYSVDAAEVRLPLPDDELAYLDLPLDYRGGGTSGSNPKVLLRAEYGGRVHEWKGSIVRTEGEIDPKSRMVHVVASVPDPYREVPGRPPLAVGMFVQAEIRGRTARDVAVLPRAAMRSDGRVWVVDGEDRLRFRDVTVLRADREVVLIADGLQDGERVCLSPMEAATDGMQVRIGDRPAGPEIPAEPAGEAEGDA